MCKTKSVCELSSDQATVDISCKYWDIFSVLKSCLVLLNKSNGIVLFINSSVEMFL